MTKSQPLVFFGNERLATGVGTNAPVLRALLAAGFQVEAVIANHTDPVSRTKRDLEIGQLAHEHGIPVLLPGPKPDWPTKLKAHRTPAAVLVAFGHIIPQAAIDLFPGGIINLHPSRLPKYRGPTPIETLILNGDKTAGVSLMKLSAKMDAGPVYVQQSIELSGQETKQELADKLGRAGAQLLVDNLADILSGQLEPVPQAEDDASYTKALAKSDGQVDWQKPAERLEREVQAFAGWPKSHAEVFGESVIITRARVAQDASDGALVMPAKESFLEILELTAPSGRTMSGADFRRGYQK